MIEFGEIANADWPWRVVEAAMVAHAASPSCLGWTYGVDGYARCGACDWCVSARSDLGDDAARGRFALIALGIIGFWIAQLVGPLAEMLARVGVDMSSCEIELVDGKLDIRYTIAIRTLDVIGTVQV